MKAIGILVAFAVLSILALSSFTYQLPIPTKTPFSTKLPTPTWEVVVKPTATLRPGLYALRKIYFPLVVKDYDDSNSN